LKLFSGFGVFISKFKFVIFHFKFGITTLRWSFWNRAVWYFKVQIYYLPFQIWNNNFEMIILK